MSSLNYLDLPTITTAGFEPGWSGQSWFGKDRYGNEWQVYEDKQRLLVFVPISRESLRMTRDRFEELFPPTKQLMIREEGE